MLKVGIVGASGYTGSRLAYHLSRHREVTLSYITSRQNKGAPMSSLYGSLRGMCDMVFSNPDEVWEQDVDLVFTCAPDHVSMKIVPRFHEKGVAIIDLAGDYRMKTAEAYRRWYGKHHESPEYISKAVYGLTELYRDRIKGARFISNPGCYPTSVILALAPLLKGGFIETDEILVASMSGISGAGREMKPYKHFYEVDSNIMPYTVGRSHKHVGEMEQELTEIAGVPCTVLFSPHVVPLKTGIVSTIYVKIKDSVSTEDMDWAYREMYAGEFFVRYLKDRLPESKNVADTNFCDIGFKLVEGAGRAVVVSAICNLGKGASGQAVQNMNVMFGFNEKEGLV